MFFGKGQVSSEFFVSFSLMLIVISTFIGVVIFLGDFNKSELQLSVEVLQDFIVNEVDLAKNSPPFFESSFSLPDKLDGFDYDVCIANSASGDEVLFVSSCAEGGFVSGMGIGASVSGDISSGSDIVVRKNFDSSIEFLCSVSGGGSCSFVAMCDVDSLSDCS